MLQLVYVSTARADSGPIDHGTILEKARRNNRRDAITGLLYSDGVRFLQALEGPDEAVEAAYARIKVDPRHRAIVLLSRRDIETREFGAWEMAHLATDSDSDAFIARVHELVAQASPAVRGTFEGFAAVRRAA